MAIDEQLCATKSCHYLKQYLPLKPHKRGYKIFVLCGSGGYSYKFEIYSGQENDEKNRLPTEIDLGACANVVIRLCCDIPLQFHHRIFFDNYYTTIPLMAWLETRGIHCLGTVRRPRIPNCLLPDEKSMAKEERGTAFDSLTVFEDIPITSVARKDNKLVTLLSSYCGILPMSTVKRFDNKQKKPITIQCSNIIKEYNKYMGGVDLLYSLIGRYKIRMRSRKWYMRLWYHLLDVSVVNSWILYRRAR